MQAGMSHAAFINVLPHRRIRWGAAAVGKSGVRSPARCHDPRCGCEDEEQLVQGEVQHVECSA